MTRKANENCLEGVRCPNCGQDTSFRVIALVAVIVTDDGAEVDPDDGDMEYDDTAKAQCRECGYMGEWGTFSTTEYGWDAVAEATESAKGIAFDGCHKIYLAMDDEQVRQFEVYGYREGGSVLITAEHASPSEMLTYLRQWYEDSCGLRFIQAVSTNDEDPNAGYVNLIPQGWDEEES